MMPIWAHCTHSFQFVCSGHACCSDEAEVNTLPMALESDFTEKGIVAMDIIDGVCYCCIMLLCMYVNCLYSKGKPERCISLNKTGVFCTTRLSCCNGDSSDIL